MLVALGTLIVTGIGGLFFADGPLFVVGRFLDVGAASIVLPVALAGVATTYQGVNRATAIGLAYGAYGAAARGPGAADPVRADRVARPGVCRRGRHCRGRVRLWPPALARPADGRTGAAARGHRHRRLGVRHRHHHGRPDRVPVEGCGWRPHRPRHRRAPSWSARGCPSNAGEVARASHPRAVQRRPVAIALFVGFVIAYAQTAALFEVPVYFQVVLGYGAILSVIATIPFMVALAAAGPVAGILLVRFSPRTLIVGGILAVGLGSIVIAAILRPGAGYLGFAISFAMIGAGFVIATTVRTAIIFASVPRGLPATAAALNEASVALGSERPWSSSRSWSRPSPSTTTPHRWSARPQARSTPRSLHSAHCCRPSTCRRTACWSAASSREMPRRTPRRRLHGCGADGAVQHRDRHPAGGTRRMVPHRPPRPARDRLAAPGRTGPGCRRDQQLKDVLATNRIVSRAPPVNRGR